MGKTMKKNKSSGEASAGSRHALFKQQVPKVRIDVPMVTEYSLYLSEFTENSTEFAMLLNELRNAKEEDIIKLFINSPGGHVSEGRALINTLQGNNADLHTELISQGHSMGALLFCIGSRRVIYENSSIMFHNYSGGMAGKGHEIEQWARHLSKNLNSFFKSIIIGLTDEEIQELIEGKDFWFRAKEMCQREIATHVNIGGILVPASEYLKVLKRAKKQAKNQGLKVSTLREAYLYGIDEISPIVSSREKELQEISTQISTLVNSYEFLYN